MWHVSSRSGVATLRTAIHLLLVTRVKDGADGAKTGRWDYQSKGVRPTVRRLLYVPYVAECSPTSSSPSLSTQLL